MRHATRNTPEHHQEIHAQRDGFVIGAVIFAAMVTALFTVHGAPNLLGDRFEVRPAATAAR